MSNTGTGTSHLQMLKELIAEMEEDYAKVEKNNLAASRRLRAKAQLGKDLFNEMRQWALESTRRPS